MRLVIGGWILSSSLFAQHVGVVNTGPRMAPTNAYQYGNILFPGGVPTHGSRLGASVSGRPQPGVYQGIGPQNPGGRPPRTTVVPYAFPVFVGGDPYGYQQPYSQPPAQNITVVVPQQPAPSVIINHNYVPDTAKPVLRDYSTENLPEGGVRVYEAPGARASEPASPKSDPQRAVASDRPTIYLIALRDSSIQSAIGYWTEAGVLHYVTPHGVVNRVSLDRIDRDLTSQLNSERKVEFSLKD